MNELSYALQDLEYLDETASCILSQTHELIDQLTNCKRNLYYAIENKRAEAAMREE